MPLPVRPGDTDPFAGSHYNTFVQTIDQVNSEAGKAGADDFWMQMYDGFAEDTWKDQPRTHRQSGRAL